MVKQAYDQIMIERKFKNRNIENEPPQVSFKQTRASLPTNIDESHLYGYKLSDEFDDGQFFKANFNETKHIFEKMQNSQ